MFPIKQPPGIVEHEGRLDRELPEPARRRCVAVEMNLPGSRTRCVVGKSVKLERRTPTDRDRTFQDRLERDDDMLPTQRRGRLIGPRPVQRAPEHAHGRDAHDAPSARIRHRLDRLNGVDVFRWQFEFAGAGEHARLVAVEGRQLGFHGARLCEVEVGLGRSIR